MGSLLRQKQENIALKAVNCGIKNPEACFRVSVLPASASLNSYVLNRLTCITHPGRNPGNCHHQCLFDSRVRFTALGLGLA